MDSVHLYIIHLLVSLLAVCLSICHPSFWLIFVDSDDDDDDDDDDRDEENGERGEEDAGCLRRSDQLAEDLLMLVLPLVSYFNLQLSNEQTSLQAARMR